MEHNIRIDVGSLGAIREGLKTAHLFHGRPGYAKGDVLLFTDGERVVSAKVVDIEEGTLANATDKDAQALGYADVNAFAVAWDAEARNREESKKWAANPVVYKVRFQGTEDLGKPSKPAPASPFVKPPKAAAPKAAKKPAAKTKAPAKAKGKK